MPVTFRWKASEKATLVLASDDEFSDSVTYSGVNAAEVFNLLLGVCYYWYVYTAEEKSEIRNFTVNPMPSSRTDLDVRFEAVGRVEHSALGSDVAFALIPCCPYGEFVEDKNTVREIFTLFTKEENYPFYVHCWGGADRTGTIILILCGILGVDEQTLYEDYEITSLSIWGNRSRKSWGRYRWFECFVAINFLLKHYNEKWIFDLAKLLRNQGIDYSELTELWKKPLNKWTLDTHIVNLVMMLKEKLFPMKFWERSIRTVQNH